MRFLKLTRHSRSVLIFIGMAILFGVAIYFRVIHLNADPANGPFIEAGDEGTHSYAARNLYLYGAWRTDGLYFAGIMPIYPLLQIIGLLLFGVHIYAFRFVNIIASVITPCVLYFFLQKELGKKSALVGTVPFLLNSFYLSFVRTGLPEGTMILFSLLAFITWYRALNARTNYYVRGIVAGCAFVLALFTKESAIWLLPVFVVTYVIFFVTEFSIRRKTHSLHKFLHIGSGFVAAIILSFLLYFVIIVLPNKSVWLTNFSAIIGGNSPHGFRSYSWWSTHMQALVASELWATLPILTLGAGIFCGLLIARYKKTKQVFDLSVKSQRLELLTIFSLFFFMLYMFVIPAPYARFLVGVLIPLSFILALLFEHSNFQALTAYNVKWVPTVLWLLVFCEIGVNLASSYTLFVQNARFTVRAAAQELDQQIPMTELSVLPVTWLMETHHKNVNTFLTPLNDYSISTYFTEYGHPKHIAIRDDQLSLYQQRVPMFFDKLRFAAKIQNYQLFTILP